MTPTSVTTAARCIVAWLMLLLAACAAPRPTIPVDDTVLHDCAAFFAALDQAVDRAGVRDAEAARVPGFPYLRVDRLLASFRRDVVDGPAFDAWVERMATLDRDARAVEIENLPAAARAALPTIAATPAQSVRDCGTRMRRAILAHPANRALLRDNTVVPDEYRTAWRVFGVYPLTALVVARGVSQWQRETHATFARPLEALDVTGTLTRYVPPRAAGDAAAVLARAPRDALGIPRLSDSDLEILYARHAPVFEVDLASAADRIGAPRWNGGDLPSIDGDDPTVYRRVSFVRAADQVLLQLNYVIWFPERPRTGAFDILGGLLDGITWRVTLAPDGRPLLYDSMHNCGCYHMFFPVEPLRLRADLDHGTEPPLVPQAAPILTDAMRIVIRFAHTTHYLERVYTTSAAVGAR